MSESEYFVIFASGRIQPYNKGTRKGANNYMTDSYFFFNKISARNSVSCSGRTSPYASNLFETAPSLLGTIIFLVSDRVLFQDVRS